AYLLSASTPIEKGINWLSQASMVLAVILLLYFLAGVGPTLLVLNTFTQEIGGYLANLIPMSLRTSAFEPTSWLGDWTIFFWATWIAWAPYVGAFIARISRGRTIRQFILGVLIAPSLFTVLWFSVFGATGIEVDNRVGGAISAQAAEDEAVALFAFLEQYPGTLLISILAIVLIWIFFVAGADAGTVVLGSMSGGVLNPRVTVKLTWGVIMAALAAILLAAGGLDALQNGAILAATPFGILMLAICWSLHRTLTDDRREELDPLHQRPATDQGEQA
ncbi:MAG: BCCT family transporter, partial [Actinomycetota bacterium]|nr:BCCT family transporter [Actinomycetota bacterium]